jgi:hypothetical protein
MSKLPYEVNQELVVTQEVSGWEIFEDALDDDYTYPVGTKCKVIAIDDYTMEVSFPDNMSWLFDVYSPNFWSAS